MLRAWLDMVRRKLPLVSPFKPADVTAAVQHEVANALGPQRSAEQVAEIAACAGDWALAATEEVEARLPPAAPIACRDGCAFCCHLKVLVTAPEVILLAEHLRATWSPEALRALKERVAGADAATRGMTTEARARSKRPCALLEDNRCGAYPARPLACRGGNSLDATLCERVHDDPDTDSPLRVYLPQLQVAEAVRVGLAAGAAMRGLDGRLFELHAALRVALEWPASAEAWADGQPSLADALDAEFAEMVREMQGPPPWRLRPV